MFPARLMIMAAGCTLLASAQTVSYTVNPFAGAMRTLGDGGSATSALLWSPRGVSLDDAGNLYIADSVDGRVRKVTPSGVITSVVGTSAGFAGDNGQATAAQISFPSKAVIAPNGDMYVADSANNRIRKVTAAGIITTFAGSGSATTSQLSFPRDVAVDATGNLYIADTNNTRIRKVTPQGTVTLVAGSGLYGMQGDGGPAVSAAMAGPRGIALDTSGNVYIADTQNNRVRKVSTDGTITTLAGGNSPGFSGDFGQAGFAQLNQPSSVAVDRAGNIYIADTGNNRVRKINTQGVITTIAGTTGNGFRGDNGTATAAMLNAPQGVALDAAGNIYIADTENHRIRKVTPQGIITTVAGSDPGSGDNGLATNARLFQPSGIVMDSSGNTYIADSNNHRVRRVTPDGMITTFAGSGSAGYSGDNGFATSAQLNSPNGLALDHAGALYIADTGNHAIRRVAGSIITTVAGTGVSGNDGDSGPATTARLFDPSAIAFDQAGNLYIADSGNNRIRVVKSGTIRNLAGDSTGQPGNTGDGGQGAGAFLNYPISLAFDDTGNLYVSDYFNSRVRKINTNGLITAFAGTGTIGAGGDGGPAAQAQLYLPAGLAFDKNRNLFIADLVNNRIRVVTVNGYIATVAGTGVFGNTGDGDAALDATLASPRDLVVDSTGNIYFTDQDNHRVRELSPSSILIRSVVNAASGIAGTIAPGEAISIFGTQLGALVTFDGMAGQTIFSSANQVNVIVPQQVAGKTLTLMSVQSDLYGYATAMLTVRDAAPGLFTMTGTGTGQGAVINQDGTINSATNPAPRGTIVAIYGTGQGILNNAAVRIGGIVADILFAGQTAPGLYQVNARVPDAAPVSDHTSVELAVGSYAAQPGVTIGVK